MYINYSKKLYSLHSDKKSFVYNDTLLVRETQNLVESRRMKEIEKDVNIEVEDSDDIVFLPSVDSGRAASVNLKVNYNSNI